MNKIFLIFFSVFLLSCRKDSPVSDDPINNPQDTAIIDSSICGGECEDFPQSPELGWFYQSSGPQYKAPCFNPNNSDEFVYLRTGVSGTELVRYNISTQSEVVLTNSMSITSQPQWGKQGWIIFTVLGNRIWKIHENGTGLEQITFFESLKPSFDTDGSNFICMGGHPSISIGYRPVLDLNGSLIDSVYMGYNDRIIGYPYFPLDSFFHKGYFAYADHAFSDPLRLGVCLYTGTDILELSSYFGHNNFLDLTANSNHLFYSEYRDKLTKIDLSSLNIETFRSGCDTRYYNHIDISPDGTKILAQKVISTIIDEYGIDEQHEIWLLDVNSCEGQKILGE
ncbi:MAG: hypothetical protein WDZ35_05990 [Crocinitomicaceae bacterium]